MPAARTLERVPFLARPARPTPRLLQNPLDRQPHPSLISQITKFRLRHPPTSLLRNLSDRTAPKPRTISSSKPLPPKTKKTPPPAPATESGHTKGTQHA